MVQDAEANSESDKKFHELVTVRNAADNLIHSSRKAVVELGDKVTTEEKDAIEAACKELEEVSKGDDKEAIEAKTKALEEVFTPVAQKAYADQAQAAGAEGAQPQEEAKQDEDVVDADFEDVDDAKK